MEELMTQDQSSNRKLMIGVIGTGGRADSFLTDEALAAAEAVGRLLAERGAVTLSGGGGGVMEAVSKGAHEAGGLTLGIIPGMDKTTPNPYVHITFTTGIGIMRNWLTIRASDAVIMISGGIGTLNELTAGMDERNIPMIVLEGTGGWSDRIREIAYDGCYLDARRTVPVNFASTPEEAVDLALKLGVKRYQPPEEG